ncbi:RNA helicase, partial [mine drainage metagenome]
MTKALGIERVIIKTEDDPDVRKYINEVKVNITRIRLPEEVREIHAVVKQIYGEIVEKLKKSGIFQSSGISRKNLIQASREISDRARNGEGNLFSIIPYITAAIRIDYALEYLESQGYLIFSSYFNEMMASEEK